MLRNCGYGRCLKKEPNNIKESNYSSWTGLQKKSNKLFGDQNPVLIYNYSLGGLVTNDQDHFYWAYRPASKWIGQSHIRYHPYSKDRWGWSRSWILGLIHTQKKLNSRSKKSRVHYKENHMHNVRLNPKKECDRQVGTYNAI